MSAVVGIYGFKFFFFPYSYAAKATFWLPYKFVYILILRLLVQQLS
jgi:hypothetical protein